MIFSIRLIITLPCTTVYHKRMKYDSTAYWLTSHKTTRDTTRAGVNLYLQNGIISCRLNKMLIPSFHISIFARIRFYVLRHTKLVDYNFVRFRTKAYYGLPIVTKAYQCNDICLTSLKERAPPRLLITKVMNYLGVVKIRFCKLVIIITKKHKSAYDVLVRLSKYMEKSVRWHDTGSYV